MSKILTAQEAMDGTSLSQVAHTAKAVIKIALSVELIGFIALVLSLAPLKQNISQAVKRYFFYDSSAE